MGLLTFLRKRPFIVLTVLYCSILIVLNYLGYFSSPPKSDVVRMISPSPVEVRGVINEVLDADDKRIRCVIKALSADGAKVSGKVLVTCFDTGNPVTEGEAVRFFARLSVPPPARNPGQFDYAAYLNRKGIYTVAYVSHVIKEGYRRLPFYMSAACAVRDNMIVTINRYLPAREAGVLIPMLIGEKSGLSQEDLEAFKDSGIVHVLVVSGMNVAYISLIFIGVFRILGFRQRHAALLSIPFILLYMFITGNNPPVVRATVMALFVIISLCLSREPRVYQSLAMAAMAILIVDPQALFTASFQLSFAATIGIVYLYPYLMKPAAGLPYLIRNTIAATIAVSLAAQLAVIPVIAYYFNKVSFIGIISNIPAVPLAGVLTATGIVLYIAHFIAGFVTVPVAFVTSLLLRCLLWLVHRFAEFPFATIHVATPSLALLAGYYALLAGVFHLKRLPARHIVGAAAAVIIVFTPHAVRSVKDGPTVTSLYAGNGTAVHVAFPGGRHWLIDAGRKRDGERVVCPYLWSKGIREIDGVIITSPDKHHYAGIENVADNFPVGKMYYPKNSSKDIARLIEGMRNTGIDLREIRANERFFVGASTVTLLSSGAGQKISLIVLIDHAGKRMAFVDHGERLAGERTADILHISCHDKDTDIAGCIEVFRPGTIILSGTAPGKVPDGGKLHILKREGSVSVAI